MASRVRQNYHAECEDGINKLIKLEMDAVYQYLALSSFFARSEVTLPGVTEFFGKAVREEMEHVQLFIDYQNKRGGRVKLEDLSKPVQQEWRTGLEAMTFALEVEREGYQSLLNLHEVADKHGDFDLANFLEGKFLKEVVGTIKEIGDYITQFQRVGAGHGEYHRDRNLE